MIRRAVDGDIDRLNELLFQVQALHAAGRPDIFKLGSKKYTTGELEAILNDDLRPVFVFEEDGRTLGYIFCICQETMENNHLRHRKTLYIDDLCVDEKARRRHIGEQLYRYAADMAARNGFDSVTLNVWAMNAGAEEFYRKMGMQPLKTYMEQNLRETAGE